MGAGSKNLAALKMLPFFATLASDTFDELTQSTRVDRLKKGEILFRQGDRAESVFVVTEGFIKLSRISLQGEETIIHIFGRGESIAESIAVLGDHHTTTAEATGSATVIRLPAKDVARVAQKAPELALTILSESSAKIWTLMDEIETLKAQTADQRVLRFLLSLCGKVSGAHQVNLPYNKGDIAASLGLKQETLSRSFARLKTCGISIDGRTANIESAERLATEIEQLNKIV